MKVSLLGRIFSNFGYKIAALVLACILWYVVQGEEILEVNRRLDVVLEVPTGFALKEANVQYRDVTLRGPRALLADLINKPLQAIIRIPSGKLGSLRFRVDKEFIRNWDNRIEITIHDPYLTVNVDEKVSRQLPIKVAMVGKPKSGLMLEDVKVDPPNVTVTGSKSELARLNDVPTEILDVEGLEEHKTFVLKINPNALAELEITPTSVNVDISLTEQKVNRKLTDIPVDALGSDYLVSMSPPIVSVVVQGTQQAIESLRNVDIQAYVDILGTTPGHHEKDVQLKLPQNLVLLEVIPKTVKVEVYNQRKLR